MQANYSGALTREQFLFHEMRITARLKLEGLSDKDVLTRVYNENLFQYPTEKEIKSKCKACLKRLACVSNMPLLVKSLAEGPAGEAKQAALIAMMCQNTLMADFMVQVIGEKYRTLDMSLTRLDMNLFFLRLQQQQEDVAAWSEQTVTRIKGVIRRCLRETEYLSGMGSEVLLPVFLPEEFADALRSNGLRAFLPAFNIFE